MNTEALFLFLILLLGLVLCSFLGGSYGKEGLENNGTTYYGPNGDTITISTDSSGNSILILNQSSGSQTVIFTQSSSNSNLYTNPFGFTATISNGNIIISTPNNESSQTFTTTPSTSSTSSTSTSSTSTSTNNYDNYNHYTGTSTQLQTGSTFYGQNGTTAVVVTNSNGTQSLLITLPGSSTPITFNPQSSSSISNYGTATTFYGPNGNTATVINTSNGQQAIMVTTSSGTFYYNVSGAPTTTTTSSQYYGSTGYPIQQSQYALAYNGPYGGSAGAVSGPYGNTAYYAQGPAGNTVAGVSSNNDYYSALPSGIPASQIPPGQEDLYILKSEVVPPVCPACPQSSACPRQEPCPPCPACARCPEPAFECKKVPNYSAMSDEYLPMPVLNDFSQFGM